MTDYKQEIEDLINSIINFKQASVDFAAEAELFSDNKTVLETANARLAQLKTEATQALAHLINKAYRDGYNDNARDCNCDKYSATHKHLMDDGESHNISPFKELEK